MVKNIERWQTAQQHTPELMAAARGILKEMLLGKDYRTATRHYPLQRGGYCPKHAVVAAYHAMVETEEIEEDPALLARIRMKPGRTLSGVSTVTVLTKPHPCPGKCIFCPTYDDMPKSYLQDEPGGARAFQNQFDPFTQVRSRLDSYLAVGHPIDKLELLILGGTWNAYPHDYREHFVQRCLDAMNGFDSSCLIEAQQANGTASSRNVGLVIETRPDLVTPEEVVHLRRLGVTKVQMGAQSLDDNILALNQRGHTAAQTLRATAMLRAAGFKIVLHWMPNLLGATIASDRQDFYRLWQGYCPDELKIYPTQLLEHTSLYAEWQQGNYQPYTMEELIQFIADLKPAIPPYCRVNRIVRDIPSTHIVAGNKRTSLRQDIMAEMERRGTKCGCIRCHEVRAHHITVENLSLEDYTYAAAHAEEHFLSYRSLSGMIAGYLRLSLPTASRESDELSEAMPELKGAALLREVHVFGQALPVGSGQKGAAQHIGLGKKLIDRACQISLEHGFDALAVISAIGTREYYSQRGFTRGNLYQIKDLKE